jgi:hypothetical protein
MARFDGSPRGNGAVAIGAYRTCNWLLAATISALLTRS